MLSRKRNSPGIEINEIDRSQYNNKPDYSMVGTTTFICGFADKGENYTTKWVNSIQTLNDQYGYPTNEVERYFHTAAIEILSKGGVLLTSKLPYENDSKDKFAYVDYNVNVTDLKTQTETNSDYYLTAINEVDTSITSYVEINSTTDNIENDLLTLDTLDKLKTNSYALPINTIRIIDITQSQYGSITLLKNEDNLIKNNNIEFIGLMPVIVSPINALFYQKILNLKTEIDTSTGNSGQELTESIEKFTIINDAVNRNGDHLSTYSADNIIDSNFAAMLSALSINDESVSKTAAKYFPTINFSDVNCLNNKYLKQIGIVIFKVYKDNANNNKINFAVVESFVGSLDRYAKDLNNGSSIFIDNIINEQSKYINVFSNVQCNNNNYKHASTILIHNQTAKILGYKKSECDKNIDYSESIIKPLTQIFDANQDPNQITIDIVCDAGVSNIAQYIKNYGNIQINNGLKNADYYPFVFKNNDDNSSWNWKIEDGNSAWKAVITKYDNFCRFTRKDCIFIADGLRPFCLDGNQKIIRSTNITNTIEKDILPNLKYMTSLNSSYSAGYCNWFYVQDYYSNDMFWCPPSIKAAGVYVYTDTYYNIWDAPAGVTRGSVTGAYDTAFSPRNDEAGKIYQQTWNYAVNYPVDGILLEGQKTFQLEATALDRINIRRLMIYLEKSVAIVARRFLYEGNTAYLRQRFVDTIKPIFEHAKINYGIIDYKIKCDDENNTSNVIDNNELRCVIAVKPVKTIEWIVCDFIVTNQSANVSEEVIRS